METKQAIWTALAVAAAMATGCEEAAENEGTNPVILDACDAAGGAGCAPTTPCAAGCDDDAATDGDRPAPGTSTPPPSAGTNTAMDGTGAEPGMAGTGGSGGAASPTPITLDCDEDAIPSSPSTLNVDVSGAAQTVHKEIFGVLLEILGRNINGGVYVGTGSSIPNTNGIRNDIIEGFREAGVGAIQWPGGCAANNYDWQANLDPPNTMGTELFMEFCRWVDAEPYLVGRPRPEFAQSNRDWVEYINDHPDHPDWHLKYFKVGNEVWGCGGDLGDDVATYESWYEPHHTLLSTPVNGKELFLVGATGGIWTVNPNT
ncbi:MAG: hypothetical protein OXT09_04350, partial [Myxococcales bacterium]|nr:hypothetical protein [Myxococcales bacterium]